MKLLHIEFSSSPLETGAPLRWPVTSALVESFWAGVKQLSPFISLEAAKEWLRTGEAGRGTVSYPSFIGRPHA